ncbi:hypothetical protein L2E82_52470 [Cichorium intybus]|nr:hypothetical protein L2E82_52470 [Cichorium intybus]
MVDLLGTDRTLTFELVVLCVGYGTQTWQNLDRKYLTRPGLKGDSEAEYIEHAQNARQLKAVLEEEVTFLAFIQN